MKRSETCGKCGARKRHDGKRLVCDDCNRKRAGEWVRDNPKRAKEIRDNHRRTPKARATRRARHLERTFGLTSLAWDLIFASQNQRCACCCSADPGSKSGWHTDHDHKTGRVRGILCAPCNSMLGQARDSAEILRAGARYLESQC